MPQLWELAPDYARHAETMRVLSTHVLARTRFAAVGKFGLRVNDGAWVNSGTARRGGLFLPKLGELGEVVIRVFRHDTSTPCQRQLFELRRDNHTSSM